jgi:hypothetical protein
VFKDVGCALPAGEVCAVPAVDADGRPRGIIAEGDMLHYELDDLAVTSF